MAQETSRSNSNMSALEVRLRSISDFVGSETARREHSKQSAPDVMQNMDAPITNPRPRPTSINTILQFSESIQLTPDRLLSPNLKSSKYASFPHRFTIQMPSELPSWLWCLLSFGLGISREKPLTKLPKCFSFGLRLLTLLAALGFAICGLVINAHEVVNENTKTTALVGLFKTAVGLFWIMLGVYSHSLAVRSFSSKGFLDLIRLHSKTFMKISAVVWITFLCISVVAINFHSNTYLLKDKSRRGNKTYIIDPTCVDFNLNVALCQVYFFFKVVFSCFNLLWILIVVAVCLSVCRTHAVCMRRFMRELCYDAKIFEEFSKLKLCQQQNQLEEAQESLEDFDSHDDEDLCSKSVDLEPDSDRKRVWNSLRKIRVSTLFSQTGKLRRKEDNFIHIGEQDEKHPQADVLKETVDSTNKEDIEYRNGECGSIGTKSPNLKEEADNNSKCDQSPGVKEENLITDLMTMKAPILNNADLLFTYFKIVKHLSTSSRLLQRWMSSSIIFVTMWCIFLVIDWIYDEKELSDIFQFLAPLIVLGFLISAYAEVNFEGSQLPKYILPTEDRLSVLYYVHNRPLEMKVYNFVLSFNILATFVTGVALTFASRIIFAKIS